MQSSRFRWKTANPLDMDRDRETAAGTNTEIRSLLEYDCQERNRPGGAWYAYTNSQKVKLRLKTNSESHGLSDYY